MISALQGRYQSFFASSTAIPFAVAADGHSHTFGSGHPEFTILVKDSHGAKALASLDQFGVAVAYLNGSLDVEGDLAAALKMRDFFRDIHPIKWASQFVPALIHGRKASDRKAISSHYDEDSDFFLSFLDERHRCYTEGVFAYDDEPIEDAMTRKMDIALEAIGAKPGDHVLEVGGGWGAFVEHAGRNGIEVTTLTLSKESERFLNGLIDREKLPAQVVREHIFSYAPGRRYDAIVNMGVTEHLPNYKATLRKYSPRGGSRGWCLGGCLLRIPHRRRLRRSGDLDQTKVPQPIAPLRGIGLKYFGNYCAMY